MVEVTLNTLKRFCSFSVAPALGLMGYDVYGLLVGLGLSVLAYQVRPRLLSPLTVKPPLPVVDTVLPLIPVGAEPCRQAIQQYQRWLQECRGNCSVCPQYYHPEQRIMCGLLEPLKGLLPDGDPFMHVLDQLNALISQNIVLLQENNRLRVKEEIRRTPWIQYIQVATNAVIMVLIGQLVTYAIAAV